MIIALKTDQPDAEVYVLSPAGAILSHKKWHAHRTLARDLLSVIRDQLTTCKADWHDTTGLVVFKGPGSFTGLRIAATVANTIAHEQRVPIVGEIGANWLTSGTKRLLSAQNDRLVLPFYGSEPNITTPKK